MRCPKCGYMSFDHLETCKKCHKHIGDLTAEINGTTYAAESPLFLKFGAENDDLAPLSFQKNQERGADSLANNEDSFNLVENSDSNFVFDKELVPKPGQKEMEFPGSGEELVMELDDITEVSLRDEFTLELDDPSNEIPAPTLDFGDLDISDLAPPSKKEPETIHFAEQPVLCDLETVATLSELPPPPPVPPSKTPSTLEDLNFNGLNLDIPEKLASGGDTGKRMLPSVKTGTALDKFDVNLGDLFTEIKK